MSGLHGVVLAAGISSRMGFPKALTPIGNSFFLHKVYQQLLAASAAPVHVVINPGLQATLKAQISKFPEADFIANTNLGLGQIESLRLGLQAAQAERAQAVLVALVDLPLVQPETYKALTREAEANPHRLIIPRWDSKTGHPYVVPASLFDRFLNASSDHTARDIMAELSDDVKYLDVSDSNILTDVDSPADLASAKGLDEDLD